MPSEMRRPGTVDIHLYVHALDQQLRREVGRQSRRSLPRAIHRLITVFRSVLEPILLGGALALTAIAVIVAVGVAPATMQAPAPAEVPLAAPVIDWDVSVLRPANRFAHELLAASSQADRGADNRDMRLFGLR